MDKKNGKIELFPEANVGMPSILNCMHFIYLNVLDQPWLKSAFG